MITVKRIEQTCTACPSQWEGVTDDDRAIYIRYRWGWLSVDVAPTIEEAVVGSEVFAAQVGDGLDGVMGFQVLKEHTAHVLDWRLT